MEGGIPVMHFRKTKVKKPRTTPLHEHLIALGFLEFAKSMGSGPLFYDSSRHKKDAEATPAEIRSRDVARWIRKTVKLDDGLQPDHGWRHTFKTKALEVGIQERISDAISGHAITGVSRKYQHPTVVMMAEALKKYPRYSV